MSAVDLLEDRKQAPRSLGRVLVLGLGKSGRAAAEYCLGLLGTRVTSLAIAAGAETDASRQFVGMAVKRGATAAYEDAAVGQLAAQGRFDLCIASPGISQFSDLYQQAAAASDQLVSEVEFAWRESARDSIWVAVTGTNGKTTVTSLIAHILQQAGLLAAAVGNIGDTCINAVAAGTNSIYVAEVSSYQLASTSSFAPAIGILLNITPDHLHWHKTHEAYRAAKLRVLANLAKVQDGCAILDATDDEARAIVRSLKAVPRDQRGFDYVPVGTAKGLTGDMRAACGSDNAAFVSADGRLAVAWDSQEIPLVAADELQIKGTHNVANALVAAAAALRLGVEPLAVAQALRSFAPLEHRIEPCGSVAGVFCYNDSKATNVDATLKAFAAFGQQHPIVLLGGRDKDTDLEPLVQAARQHARAVVCFGEAAERFLPAFSQGFAEQNPQGCLLLQASHLEQALDQALRVAQAGDIVLLSPACASFDEFGSFEQRGDAFKQLVAQRAMRAGN